MPVLSKNELEVHVKSTSNNKGLKDTEKGLRDLGGEAEKSAGRLGSITRAGVQAGLAGIAAATVLVIAGIGGATTAAFEQVKQVENASSALRAYEKDGAKVSKVLGQLVSYARSDMGVLFQREDLFKAASNLRGFGESADTVTGRVKTLSKGVALGMTTFDELSQIIGRSTQAGNLSAEAFDQLAYRGIILDSSLRGADISADNLYKALEKALPDSLLAGRADTIEGRMIRLQSAFRDVGSSILGVDKETSKFIEGGLGDRFLNGVEGATGLLKAMSPVARDLMSNLGAVERGARELGGQAIELGTKVWDTTYPALSDLGRAVSDDLAPALTRLWKEVIEPLLPVLGKYLVGNLVAVIDTVAILVRGFSVLTNAMLDGNPVVLTLIGSLAGLGVALALTTGVNAFIGAMGTMTTSFKAFRLLALTPMTMPAIAVAAALVALGLVISKAIETKSVIEETTKNIEDNYKSIGLANEQLVANANQFVDPGRRERARNTLRKMGVPGYASGTMSAAGGASLVGERGPELINLPRGSQVIPARETRQMVSGAASRPSVVINQTNHNYMQYDADQAAEQLGWELSRA